MVKYIIPGLLLTSNLTYMSVFRMKLLRLLQNPSELYGIPSPAFRTNKIDIIRFCNYLYCYILKKTDL